MSMTKTHSDSSTVSDDFYLSDEAPRSPPLSVVWIESLETELDSASENEDCCYGEPWPLSGGATGQDWNDCGDDHDNESQLKGRPCLTISTCATNDESHPFFSRDDAYPQTPPPIPRCAAAHGSGTSDSFLTSPCDQDHQGGGWSLAICVQNHMHQEERTIPVWQLERFTDIRGRKLEWTDMSKVVERFLGPGSVLEVQCCPARMNFNKAHDDCKTNDFLASTPLLPEKELPSTVDGATCSLDVTARVTCGVSLVFSSRSSPVYVKSNGEETVALPLINIAGDKTFLPPPLLLKGQNVAPNGFCHLRRTPVIPKNKADMGPVGTCLVVLPKLERVIQRPTGPSLIAVTPPRRVPPGSLADRGIPILRATPGRAVRPPSIASRLLATSKAQHHFVFEPHHFNDKPIISVVATTINNLGVFSRFRGEPVHANPSAAQHSISEWECAPYFVHTGGKADRRPNTEESRLNAEAAVPESEDWQGIQEGIQEERARMRAVMEAEEETEEMPALPSNNFASHSIGAW